MSSAAEAPEEKKSSRRRPLGNRRRRGPRKTDNEENNENKQSNTTERKEREPIVRPPSLPVPADLNDKKAVGIVTAVIRKGRVKFGFIHIGDGSKPNEEVPKIYFNFSEIVDKSLIVRRDYIVEFTCKFDDTGRSFASQISLTEQGKKVAAEKDEAIAKKRAERPSESNGAETSRRPIRERKVLEPKMVTLLVSVEGKSGDKSIEVDLNQSIGRLKGSAVAAFELTALYNVYHGEEFLTKTILNKLSNNDKVRLVEAKESAK